MDLEAELPRLLPRVIAWAERTAREAGGTPLTDDEAALGRAVGVAHPEAVRIVDVDALPMPADADLRVAATQAGLLAPGMVGLTLGHAIFVRRGYRTRRLLSHELRHVHQYEQAGSIAAFLPVYLAQIVACGYQGAAYERDARLHETRDA